MGHQAQAVNINTNDKHMFIIANIGKHKNTTMIPTKSNLKM